MPIIGSTGRVGDKDVVVLVEVDDFPADASAEQWGVPRGDRLKKVIDATRDVFGDGLDLARDCALRAADTFDRTMDGDHRPDAFELQLALRLDAEAGAVLTKVGAGAQVQVTLKWNRPRSGSPQPSSLQSNAPRSE
jgi:hypothetical protein